MSIRDLNNDLHAAFSIALIVLIAILMVSASSVVVLMYQGGQSEESSSIQTARIGDTVKVDYVGRLGDGRVFDTSIWTVASNDALYPKSLSFTLRDESAYEPLEFDVGSGQLIKGFDRGVIGMAVGETKVLTVLPKDGYGQLNESKLKHLPLVESLPVFESINVSEFLSRFLVTPRNGLTVEDPKWGWEVTVLDVDYDADRVVIMNSPVLGGSYAVYGNPQGQPGTGWYAVVDRFDSSANGGAGLIEVRHLLSPEDAGYVKGVDSSGNEFLLMEVDPESNDFVLNYNSEVTGVTLYFTVTLVSIAST
ncbi:MAG: FKBP-type peptidyl-prolyl cis-trans isomerase [Methanomassiliicoccales archaeon]|nr:FKBP-type peptidyl-prolyl cis-trans isomerase [Methanomassiliicoccales archaeon]